MDNAQRKALWIRLKEYNFDHLVPPHLWDKVVETFGSIDASMKAFAHKLVRKFNWRLNVAIQAIEEYKRFVYLGVTSDFHITPSAAIDKVWHEHQLFNEAYRLFCNEILKVSFDHSPELLPHEEETAVFNAQYLATLELYRKEFGQEPPENIWGKPKFDPNTVQTKTAPRKKHHRKRVEQ